MITRFAVGTPDGPRSATWRLWRHTNPRKADVFLAPRSLASMLKVSFHESGEVRDAFTREYTVQHRDVSSQGGTRSRLVWHRADYAQTGVVRLYQLCIPHSELRIWPSEENGPTGDIVWIPPSPLGDATLVELVLTRPGLESLQLNDFVPATPGPLAHWYLPTGENFLALPRVGSIDNAGKQQIAEAAAAAA